MNFSKKILVHLKLTKEISGQPGVFNWFFQKVRFIFGQEMCFSVLKWTKKPFVWPGEPKNGWICMKFGTIVLLVNVLGFSIDFFKILIFWSRETGLQNSAVVNPLDAQFFHSLPIWRKKCQADLTKILSGRSIHVNLFFFHFK